MTTDNRAPPYSLRLEKGLRAKLETAAKIAGRSLHSEIALRLISTFEELPAAANVQTAGDVLRLASTHTYSMSETDNQSAPTNEELFNMLDDLRGRVEELERRNQ
ncbi:Arc family DNA-binding protein [Thiothrix lacustris]|uniref:Arc family DNA-binding protein n=1 Tax=Thiothrix lacustris TaxID=525917 RepID=A0ABY9MRD1_9GAMM|nr:Arc family DNA-binding protein [Thiothrix lacustris]WML91142.1 Arc family DNA-binding protein [Thiothrix lacustris]